ncbi:MAG: glycosyltransferase family 2 protein [Selenomonas sp.]|uniref:glycosyltransferase family 2 protein n=1 Tax=Selenomonas sp. TaxID=2053611 RepID=UPI0025CEF804|nr:glycosyltransferase family 2 protein [Selenomonas sp.]MCI6233159.1 glycosyltransferase family 2 protein [Selenomonas sp.]
MRKIAAIVMVKNEMDIIESFVRHTLGFADLLIVADHKSTDRTREILEALKEEGLPVLIEDVAVARHAQAETMTRLLWLAADEHQADLIVPLDADEFLVPTGEAAVRDVLEALTIDDVCSLRWQRYLPQSDDGIPAGVFALSVPLLRAKEQEQGQKIIVRGDVVRRDHPGLAEGNHMILREGGMAHGEHGDFCDGLELAHLVWRNPAQICSKYAVGWPNIAGKYGLSTPSGGGYQGVFERIRRGETPKRTEDDRAWEPCSLAGRVPFPTLRYSENTIPNVLANVMAASEALAAELAETRALASQPLVTTIVPYLGGGDRRPLQTNCFKHRWHRRWPRIIRGMKSSSLFSEASFLVCSYRMP